jgi:hypothetical protein
MPERIAWEKPLDLAFTARLMMRPKSGKEDEG